MHTITAIVRYAFGLLFSVALAAFGLESCRPSSHDHQAPKIEMRRKSDAKLIFISDYIHAVICDPNGGLVVPFSAQDSETLERVTSDQSMLNEDVVVSTDGVDLAEIHVYAGFANGFIYLRGDYKSVLDKFSANGVKILRVDEIPASREEVQKILR